MSNSLTAVISADTTQFEHNLTEAQRTLSRYKDTAKKASSAISDNVSVTTQQANAYQRVLNQLNKVNEGTLTSRQETKKLKEQIQELRIQWTKLSDEQKKSDFGKSIAQTMRSAEEQLNRTNAAINSARQSTGQMTTATNTANSSIMDMAACCKEAVFAFGALSGAYNVLKDAINTNETAIDAWGRTIAVAKAEWDGFLRALANHDFSSLISNLGLIADNAERIYNMKDAAGTYEGASAQEIAGYKDKIVDLKLKKKKATPEEAKLIDREIEKYQNLINDVESNNAVKKMNVAAAQWQNDVMLAYKNVGYSEDEAYEKAEKLWKRYCIQPTTFFGKGGFIDSKKNAEFWNAQTPTGEYLRTTGKRWKALDAVADLETTLLGYSQEYAAAQEAYTQVKNKGLRNIAKTPTVKPTVKPTRTPSNQYEKEFNLDIERYLDNAQYSEFEYSFDGSKKSLFNGSVYKKGWGSKQQLLDKIKELKEIQEIINPFATYSVLDETGQLDKKKSGFKIIEEHNKKIKKLEDTIKLIDTYTKEQGHIAIGGDEKLNGVKEFSSSVFKDWQDAQDAQIAKALKLQDTYAAIADTIGLMGQAMAGTNDKGLNIAGMIAQAIATMIIGYAQATKMAAEIAGPWGWISFGALGLAQLTGMISAVQGMNKYADGGIISGATSVGDLNYARVNAGEMILNGSQQSRLFRLLNDGSTMSQTDGGSSNVRFRIEGKDLVGVLNTYNNKNSRVR